jgi:hypothetical protein
MILSQKVTMVVRTPAVGQIPRFHLFPSDNEGNFQRFTQHGFDLRL